MESRNEPRDSVPSVLEVNKYADFESYDTFKSVICIHKARLQPNSSIFGLTKYIRQIVQYLVVYRISVFGIRLAHEYIW